MPGDSGICVLSPEIPSHTGECKPVRRHRACLPTLLTLRGPNFLVPEFQCRAEMGCINCRNPVIPVKFLNPGSIAHPRVLVGA
jgi:hypothetical protein